MIGLQDSVAMCNSIPPSLFLPLASLLDLGSLSSLIQVGPLTTYVPIGIKELSLWDKFRDVRGTKGQTARLGLSSSQQASNGQAAVTATAGMPRSLRRQYQSMGNIDPVVRSSSEISMAVPNVGSHLSVAAPNPFASIGAAAGVVGGSLPVSPYQQQYSPVAAMFYYVPTSPYSMHYPPTHYPYQPNGYAAWPATSPSPSPPIAQRHSEPYLPNFFQRTSGLVPTVEEAEVETNESERASSLAPPVSNTSIAPENPPSASGSGPEVGNSSMSSAGIRSILGSVEADGSDSSKWHSSSTEPSYGPSLDSVIPQPLSSSSEGKDQKQKEPRRGSRNSKWSTSLFQIILGEDHRDLCWWYYCKDDGDANEAVSGPWDSETMLIKVAAERSLERVYACSTRKSASPSSGSHPDKEAFSRITDLLAAANRE